MFSYIVGVSGNVIFLVVNKNSIGLTISSTDGRGA